MKSSCTHANIIGKVEGEMSSCKLHSTKVAIKNSDSICVFQQSVRMRSHENVIFTLSFGKSS